MRRVESILEQAQNRERADDAPPELAGRPIARTYFEIVGEELRAGGSASDRDVAGLAVRIEDIVEGMKIVGWVQNTDVQNRMRTAIEDELFEFQAQHAIKLPFESLDRIMDQCIEVARRRSTRP